MDIIRLIYKYQGSNFSLIFVIIPASLPIFFSENESSDFSRSHQRPKKDFRSLANGIHARLAGMDDHFSFQVFIWKQVLFRCLVAKNIYTRVKSDTICSYHLRFPSWSAVFGKRENERKISVHAYQGKMSITQPDRDGNVGRFSLLTMQMRFSIIIGTDFR